MQGWPSNYTSSTHCANAGATPLAMCFKNNTSATRLGASFPPGRKDQGDPVARAMRAAMLEAVGGLGCAVGGGQCIGTLIGNRLELSLFLSSPVRDIGSCGGAI